MSTTSAADLDAARGSDLQPLLDGIALLNRFDQQLAAMESSLDTATESSARALEAESSSKGQSES